MPHGIELKAQRREPSVENHCEITDIPAITGVLACFRLHQTNALGHKNTGRQMPTKASLSGYHLSRIFRNPRGFASIQMPLLKMKLI